MQRFARVFKVDAFPSTYHLRDLFSLPFDHSQLVSLKPLERFGEWSDPFHAVRATLCSSKKAVAPILVWVCVDENGDLPLVRPKGETGQVISSGPSRGSQVSPRSDLDGGIIFTSFHDGWTWGFRAPGSVIPRTNPSSPHFARPRARYEATLKLGCLLVDLVSLVWFPRLESFPLLAGLTLRMNSCRQAARCVVFLRRTRKTKTIQDEGGWVS